jgi:DNA invertase Pin-like site-specific DNA recombinase
MTKRAFLYARCSTEEQKDGRTLKRQESAVRAYCDRHGLTLDDRRFIDLGLSGYTGANVSHGELGVFLEMVRGGRIPKGSVLVVERLDRLSREVEQEKATQAIYPIIRAGVELATTSPEIVYNQANIDDMATWLPLRIYLAQAADESRKTSERMKDVHGSKRAAALANRTPYGRRPPSWLRLVGQTTDGKRIIDPGRYEVIEEKAALVRRMFDLAAEGLGTARIAGVLDQEHPEGLTGRGWQPGQINVLLRSRSVLGEYQPHVGTMARKGRKKTRQPVGDPVKGFYPAIISEADFYRVQTALDGRGRAGGRARRTPNLFNGILYDARDGRRMVMNAIHDKRVLVSSGAIRKQAGSAYTSIRYAVFERAILGLLAEVKASDVLGRPGAAEDRLDAASGRLTTANKRLDAANAKAAAADDPTDFMALIADLTRQKKAAVKELEEAKASAVTQAGDHLGEFKSLVHLLDEAPPEEKDALRLKVRVALRRVVKEMRAYVAVEGRERMVGVEVHFNVNGGKGKVRFYTIYYRQPYSNGHVEEAGGWKAESCIVENWAATVGTPLGALFDIKYTPKLFALLRNNKEWMDQPLNPMPTT